MPRVPIPLNGFYVSDSLPISAQECTNWRVNIPQTQGALSQSTLYGTEGVIQLLTTGNVRSKNRGAHVKEGKPYFLNGETLYRVDRSFDANGNEVFNAVTLGNIPGDERVSMDDNGKQLIFSVRQQKMINQAASAANIIYKELLTKPN